MRVQDAVVSRILELIQTKNVTLHKLAIMSAVPPSTLKNIINGNSNNTGISTIAKLCDGLGITIKEFFQSDIFDNLEQEVI